MFRIDGSAVASRRASSIAAFSLSRRAAVVFARGRPVGGAAAATGRLLLFLMDMRVRSGTGPVQQV
jgi:hypothetical protein